MLKRNNGLGCNETLFTPPQKIVEFFNFLVYYIIMITTEHKYVIKDEKIYSGSPIIKGTRIPVKAIVIHYQSGMSIEDILEGYPSINPAQLFDALSYYHDNKEEIEKDIERDSVVKIKKEFAISQIDSKGRISFK